MDAHSLHRQASFPPLGSQHLSNNNNQSNMFFPPQQHQPQHRSTIDADALAAGVHRFIPNSGLSQHNLPPQQLQQRPLTHPNSYPRPFAPHPHLMQPHGHGHRPTSYITLPPGVDPSTVDFRTFYPYDPQVVKHRKRTTRAQLKVLEDTFKKETKPNGALRKKLAAELDMTPRGVQVSCLRHLLAHSIPVPPPRSPSLPTNLGCAEQMSCFPELGFLENWCRAAMCSKAEATPPTFPPSFLSLADPDGVPSNQMPSFPINTTNTFTDIHSYSRFGSKTGDCHFLLNTRARYGFIGMDAPRSGNFVFGPTPTFPFSLRLRHIFRFCSFISRENNVS